MEELLWELQKLYAYSEVKKKKTPNDTKNEGIRNKR